MSSNFDNKLTFKKRQNLINENYAELITKKNSVVADNGIFSRYENCVLTAGHIPPFWIYDMDYKTNPFFQQRLSINAVFNPGAIKFNGKYILVARVEGADRKSFFAIAESDSGTEGFKFWDKPVVIPEYGEPDVNIYDMRLTNHEDGWIYGVFCTERKDPAAKSGDTSSAVAQAGIARTKNFIDWERLPDIKTPSAQQRNVVLHPEFVDKKYAFYTRPQDGFIDAGSGGGIGWGLCNDIENAVIKSERVIDERVYHTIKEVKNGQGPAPLKTSKGWMHLAHGVRNTAAGLRYVLYLFLTDLKDPGKVIRQPAGYLIAPKGAERVGDVSNVVFSNGWIRDEDGKIYIYYASSDTRIHVAATSESKLLDYLFNSPPDPLTSAKCVEQRIDLIDKNLKLKEA